MLIKKCSKPVIVLLLMVMTACSSGVKELKAPCQNFGERCYKVPINHWDDRDIR